MAYAWGDSRRREVARGSGDSVGRGGFQELIQSQLVDAYLLRLHAGLASVNRNCLRSTEHRSVLTICDMSDNMRPDSDEKRSGWGGPHPAESSSPPCFEIPTVRVSALE